MTSSRPPDARAWFLIATTWHCNLRCSYCFVRESGLDSASASMSPDLAVRVVDALDAGLPHVESICLHLYGGEPLTNLPAMEALVERARGKAPGRFSFEITTNGTVLSRRALDLLQAGHFGVVLSVDGPAEVHDACRRTHAGEPTHARVLEFLDALRAQTDCRVRGSSVVRSGWSLAQASAYLHSLPVGAHKAQMVRGVDGPLALTAEERQAYLRDLEAIGQETIDALEAGHVPRDDRYRMRLMQLFKGTPRESFCGAGRAIFGITPFGDVLPCVLLDAEAHRLGHIDGAPGTWLEAGLQWRAAHRPRGECTQCDALPLCGGGCPAMLSACGAEECEITRHECRVVRSVYEHFRDREDKLFPLFGIKWD